MLYFDSDYMAGAHAEVLDALVSTNMQSTVGYGEDDYSRRARNLVRQACGCADLDVNFLVGGTQTNSTVIDALLRPTDAVIAAATGHISVHEAGAVEASGHKVITLPEHEGKISAADLRNYLHDFYSDETWPHMPIPGMVYISYPTEYGTLYNAAELEEISAVCHEYNLPLYLDGARLAYGLAASSEVTLPLLSRLCDAFYIGGTKCGLLFGEALVSRKGLLRHFFTLMKQRGAVLAKGRLLGLQFGALFADGLYDCIGKDAVALAQRLRKGFEELGYEVAVDSPTNQQFFRLPNEVVDRLRQFASFEYWGPRGTTHSVVRFVTSWATQASDIDTLLSLASAKQ